MINSSSKSARLILPKIKLVAWDLDHTLWNGTLIEGDFPGLFDGRAELIAELDKRGILQSIVSKNNHEQAMEHLGVLGLSDYFLYPQISWSTKSSGIAEVASKLNIGIDTIILVDDQPFEIEEVSRAHPNIRTVLAESFEEFARANILNKMEITEESSQRRRMYRHDQLRAETEKEFQGTPDEFLATLNLDMTIRLVGDEDLGRAEELITRTNQLNSTGQIYSLDELKYLSTSPTHIFLCVELEDRFGAYGNIGLILIEEQKDTWTLKQLLVSCRVLSRGVGPLLLNYVSQRAMEKGKKMRVVFRDTGKNRAMKFALMLTGFQKQAEEGEVTLLERPDDTITIPEHFKIRSRV